MARQRSFGSVAFFLSFVTLGHVLMLSSLLVALMLAVYACEAQKAVRDEDCDDKMSLLCAEIAAAAPEHSKKTDALIMLFSAVRDKFAKYDLDDSGSLLPDELRELLVELLPHETFSESELDAVMKEMDHSTGKSHQNVRAGGGSREALAGRR